MSESPELKAIKKCAPNLERALKGLDRDLVHFLNDEGFISDEVLNKVLNPVSVWSEDDKATELVKWIRNRVKQDPASFHTLLAWFKARGKYYEPIMMALEAEMGGTPSQRNRMFQASLGPRVGGAL